MVGHIHEDIDQNFSCLSRYLKKNSAVTLDGNNIIEFVNACLNYVYIYICICRYT